MSVEGPGAPLCLVGRLRFRARPLERSSIIYFAAAVSAWPLVAMRCDFLAGLVGLGIVGVLVAIRSVTSVARPRLCFEEGTRFLSWRFRNVQVRLGWTSLARAPTGKSLIVLTEAGPLEAAPTRESGERDLDRVIASVEVRCPTGAAAHGPNLWPSEFGSALELLQFESVSPTKICLRSGGMGMFKAGVMILFVMGLSWAVSAIEPPPGAAAVVALTLACWPFLFSVRNVALQRNAGKALVGSKRSSLSHELTADRLTVTSISADGIESFGLRIEIDGKWLALPGLTASREIAESARRALLEYSSSQSGRSQ
jgi:hypothetical protein